MKSVREFAEAGVSVSAAAAEQMRAYRAAFAEVKKLPEEISINRETPSI